MRMNGQHYTIPDINLINKYLYNSKELQDQTNYYDYGFRQMDPQLGRWHVVDALAEKYLSSSPYAYVENDPINHRDFMGLWKQTDYKAQCSMEESRRLGHGGIGSFLAGLLNGDWNQGGNRSAYSMFMGQLGNRGGHNTYNGFLASNNLLSSGGNNGNFRRHIGLREMVREEYFESTIGGKTTTRLLSSESFWMTSTYYSWEENGETMYYYPDGGKKAKGKGGKIIRADLSKENAGELLLYNLRNYMLDKPYLKDLVKPSSFPKSLLARIFGNGGFGQKGEVNIAGKTVELQIVHYGWFKTPDTHLNEMWSGGGKIKFNNHNDMYVIIFRFNDNMNLYNTVLRYFAGGPAPNFIYIKP